MNKEKLKIIRMKDREIKWPRTKKNQRREIRKTNTDNNKKKDWQRTKNNTDERETENKKWIKKMRIRMKNKTKRRKIYNIKQIWKKDRENW